jgi:hypothetical protein
VRERRQIFYQLVYDTIQQLKDEGEGEVLDVGVTTLSFVGVLVWLAYWYHPEGRLTKEQIIDEIIMLTVDRMVGLNLSGNRHQQLVSKQNS